MFSGLKIKWKLAILLCASLAGIVFVGGYGLLQVKTILIEARKQEVKNLTVSAASVIKQFRAKEDQGLLSKADAQKAAFEALRGVRFGENDYFFVYEYDGVNRMLGPRPEFEGQNKIDLKDANGTPFVKHLIEQAQTGGGFVHYLFPRAGAKEASPKLAYAEPIGAWNLFIGTGVYIDDIDHAFANNAKRFAAFGLCLLLVIGFCAAWISHSITKPLSRITAGMNALAAGNKNISIDYLDKQNEVGDLARALQTFKAQALEVDRLQAERLEQEKRAEQDRRRLLHEMADKFEQSVKSVVAAVSSAATEMQSSAQSLASTA